MGVGEGFVCFDGLVGDDLFDGKFDFFEIDGGLLCVSVGILWGEKGWKGEVYWDFWCFKDVFGYMFFV